MTSNTTISIPNGTLSLNAMKIEQNDQGWGYTDLSVRKHNSDNAIVLRSRSGSNDLYLKLDAGEAAQLRDHISALIVDITPKPKTERELFDEIPVGSDFIWVIDGKDSTRYRKVDSERFRAVGADGLTYDQYFSRSGILRDRATLVSFRVVPQLELVHPAVEEQYNKLPIGAQFKWRRRETGQEATNTYIKVPGGALPLGYASGEVWPTTHMFTFDRLVELIPVNLD